MIRAAAEGSEPDPLIDLSQIDFDALAARFAGRKRAETDRLAALLKQRAIGAATRNPTRYDLVERIEELIADYNAGSLNIDEYLRRLIELSRSLDRRGATGGHRGPDRGRAGHLRPAHQARPGAHRRRARDRQGERQAAARPPARQARARLAPQGGHHRRCPHRRSATSSTPTSRPTRTRRSCSTPRSRPSSTTSPPPTATTAAASTTATPSSPSTPARGVAALGAGPVTTAAITEEVVEQLRVDAEFASLVAEKLGLTGKPELRTIDELIDNDEDYAVEFKSTARWDLREDQPSKAMEDAVVKTVAGFLNTDGGTLLIGVGPDGEVVGLDHDYAAGQAANGDGFVNWLTTHLINALGHTARDAHPGPHRHPRRPRDLPPRRRRAHPQPVWAKTSKDDRVFFVRMNNSTREPCPTTSARPTAPSTGLRALLLDERDPSVGDAFDDELRRDQRPLVADLRHAVRPSSRLGSARVRGTRAPLRRAAPLASRSVYQAS